ncbi:biotin transport system substrate-specific component [Bhargavaea beijingensis]|uniref:Biotin transporter n=1 Tax=Bhargavaea beijingensis TaxID=426756 RepID=A0A1G7D1Y4_9BACL|nr:biotin transporter BioY [Bhargavaea beijingensis]SDE45612.1 biotin transport system substrate-specific component [Bhargavaea beijingensis]
MKANRSYTLAVVSLFASLTAVGAFIKIPLPFVPFSLQILFVFLAGSLLGSRRGVQSQLVYVFSGLAGLPVFTQGGGIGYVLQPTFGYLIGFTLAAFVVGRMTERSKNPKAHSFIAANLVGVAIIYIAGVSYLYLALNTWMGIETSWSHVVMVGFVYGIGGDLIISVAAGLMAIRLRRIIAARRLFRPDVQMQDRIG